MENIKFRIWDEDNECFDFIDLLDIAMTIETLDSIRDYFHPDYLKTNNNFIQKNTGLKDRKGVDISEGDILTSDIYPFNDNGISNYVAVVTWIFSSWQIVLKCVNPLKSGISSGINHDLSEYIGDSDVLNFEVIGNIHENPELLR